MEIGSVVGSIDVAQLVLYAFFLFFIGLVIYLRREDKREGYPLEGDGRGRGIVQGYPTIPAPKTFLLAHGGTVSAPSGKGETREIRVARVGASPGAPHEPTGDPMADGVGPASYAERAEVPDMTVEGDIKIVPLRVAGNFSLESRDPDPRGMAVVGADGVTAGTVTDVWIDRSEIIARYLEVELAGAGGRRVLLPVNFSKIDGGRRRVHVRALVAANFAGVPALAMPDQITLREEDRICGYYGGGTLYATPQRMGPIL